MLVTIQNLPQEISHWSLKKVVITNAPLIMAWIVDHFNQEYEWSVFSHFGSTIGIILLMLSCYGLYNSLFRTSCKQTKPLILFSLLFVISVFFHYKSDSLQSELEVIILVFTIVIWFQIIYYTEQQFRKNQSLGLVLVMFTVLSFVFFFYKEFIDGYKYGIALFYQASVDFVFFVGATFLAVEINSQINKRLLLAEKYWTLRKFISFVVLILYTGIVNEFFLQAIHQTSILRYQSFWHTELPIFLSIIVSVILLEHVIDPVIQTKTSNTEHWQSEKIIVKKPKKDHLLSYSEIALIIIYDGLTVAYTHSKEKHILDSSLNELEKKLGNHQFFRVNRQLILSKGYIVDYIKEKNQKLRVVYLSHSGKKETAVISRYRAPKFKKWYRSQ